MNLAGMTAYGPAIITEVENWGMIPSFFDPEDPTPMKDQFDAGYYHGGGWRPHPNTKWELINLDEVGRCRLHSITHDEYFEERGRLYRGDEFAIIFDSDFVAYMPSNEGPLEVSRMD